MSVPDLPQFSRLSRRSFFGASLGASLLAACGGSATTAPPQIVGLFSTNRVIAAGRPQRLPFGLVDTEPAGSRANTTESVSDSTDLAVRVLFDGDTIDTLSVQGRVVEHDHAPESEAHQHANLLRYYAVRTTLPEVGIYDLEVTIANQVVSLPVQAFDPTEIVVPLVGDAFPLLDTPTLDDPRSVDPVCTLFGGPCPFHTRTAAEIIGSGQQMALLVATPTFCATSYCGPVLNTLIDAASSFPSVGFVHVEPWANPTEGAGLTDPNLRRAPAIDAMALSFEPALFLVDGNGTIVERIDNVFDADELRAALATIE